jgi:hypothetical protein
MGTPSLKELVIIHINYRDVFNAPVNVYDLQSWVGVTEALLLIRELDDLIDEGLIETDGNHNYCVAGRSEVFSHRAAKKRLSAITFKNHQRIINYLSWIPFIRFIGISGSIAAENPTVDHAGIHKGSVDLDVFVITSPNSLWMVFFFERILTNLFTLLLRGRYLLCFNYAMDGTFLEIHNRNIYTATELFNLKTVFNKSDTIQQLMKVNAWAGKYYPTLSTIPEGHRPALAFTLLKDLLTVMMYPLNFSAFVLFQFFRCWKNRSLQPMTEISTRFSAGQRNNLKRICTPYGGYEEWVRFQFEKKFKENFNPYFKSDFIEFLFPKRHFAVKDVIVDPELLCSLRESFTKYNITSPQ